MKHNKKQKTVCRLEGDRVIAPLGDGSAMSIPLLKYVSLIADLKK